MPSDRLKLLPPLEHGSDEWVERRNSYIGSSEVATILGVNKYQTPWQLWAVKTGRVEPPVVKNDAVDLGNYIEPLLVKKSAEKLALPFTPSGNTWALGVLSATPDGIATDEDGNHVLVECKADGARDTSDWDRLESSGEAVLGTKVGGYYLQLQHQLYVMDAAYGAFSVYTGTQHRAFLVERNESVIEMAVSRCLGWWHEHIANDVEPPREPSDIAQKMAMLKRSEDEEQHVISGDEAEALLRDYHTFKDKEKAAKKKKKEALDKLAAMAEGHHRVSICGQSAGWVQGTYINTQRLGAKHKDLLEEFREESTPYFTIFRGGKS